MLLDARGIDAHYGSSHVLHDAAVQVEAGECLAVLGRNGMGKTTLVHVLAGLHPVSSGTVRFKDVDITGMSAQARNHRGMALVPQGHRVFGSLTVAENLAVAARDRSSIGDVMTRFPILADRRLQFAGNMSGGQQQILALARALVADADLVLMDEPSEGLDPKRIGQVGEVIRDLTARGCAVLLVEQRVTFALEAADHVAIMERGSIESVTTVADARAHPERIRAQLGLA